MNSIKALNNIDLLFIQRTYWLVTTCSHDAANTIELPYFFEKMSVFSSADSRWSVVLVIILATMWMLSTQVFYIEERRGKERKKMSQCNIIDIIIIVVVLRRFSVFLFRIR